MKRAYFSRAILQGVSASADTWAIGNSSNVLSLNRSAQGAASDILSVPFTPVVPNAKDGKQIGIKPLQVKAQLSVGVAALSQAPTIKLYKTSVFGTSSPAAVEITGTLGGYSAATGLQNLIYDLSYLGDALLDANSSLHAELTVNPAATTTISIFDLVLKYELVENAQA